MPCSASSTWPAKVAAWSPPPTSPRARRSCSRLPWCPRSSCGTPSASTSRASTACRPWSPRSRWRGMPDSPPPQQHVDAHLPQAPHRAAVPGAAAHRVRQGESGRVLPLRPLRCMFHLRVHLVHHTTCRSTTARTCVSSRRGSSTTRRCARGAIPTTSSTASPPRGCLWEHHVSDVITPLREIHHPPETASIMLIARIFASLVQVGPLSVCGCRSWMQGSPALEAVLDHFCHEVLRSVVSGEMGATCHG